MIEQLSPEVRGLLRAISDKLLAKSKKDRLEGFIRLNPSAKKHSTVCIGDSITEQFPIAEMLSSSVPIYNRGIGGFTTSELLENLQVVLYDLEPRKVFLMIGTNDMGKGSEPEQIALQIEKNCEQIQERLPQAELFVESVYPVNERAAVSPFGLDGRSNEKIMALNERIQDICARKQLTYIPVYPQLIDENGALKTTFTTDGLHLNVQGYEAVSQTLAAYL